MKVLIIDNYDSFTYNIAYLIRQCGHNPAVVRNTEIDVQGASDFDKILLSPGPGLPNETKNLKKIIEALGHCKSILGICLGHQAIAEVYGAKLEQLHRVLHGTTTTTFIEEEADALFAGLPWSFETGHYHSWVVDGEAMPKHLKITARNIDNLIMGIRHSEFDVSGLQFHPESILTPHGPRIISNWLSA